MSSHKNRWLAPTLAVLFLLPSAVMAQEKKEEEKKEPPPAAPAPDPKGPGLAGYKKNFHIESADGKFSIDFGGRLQFRATNTDPEEGDSKTSFRIRRMKVFMEGFAFDKDLKYKVQANYSSGVLTLEDAIINVTKVKAASFQFGQYKAPLGIQELTSSGSQQFVDRSIVSEKFAVKRDIGVMLHGKFLDNKLGYQVGIFNGAGVNVSSNDDDKFLTVERFEITPFGEYSYYESSVKDEDLKMLIGLAASQNTVGVDSDDDDKNDVWEDENRFEVDFSLRWKRLSLLADYYGETQEPFDGSADVDASGLLAQVGVFAIPKHLEFALRHAVVDPNTDKDKDKETETRFGVNYFWSEHKYKVQLDYGMLDKDKDDVTDKETRLQFQLIF